MNVYIDPLATVMNLRHTMQCTRTGIVCVDPRAWHVLWARYEALNSAIMPQVYVDLAPKDYEQNKTKRLYHYVDPEAVRDTPGRCVWGTLRILLHNPARLKHEGAAIEQAWKSYDKPHPLTPEAYPWAQIAAEGILTDSNGTRWHMKKVED